MREMRMLYFIWFFLFGYGSRQYLFIVGSQFGEHVGIELLLLVLVLLDLLLADDHLVGSGLVARLQLDYLIKGMIKSTAYIMNYLNVPLGNPREHHPAH